MQYGVRGGGKAALAEERPGPCSGRPGRRERRSAGRGPRIGRHEHGELDSHDTAEDPESETEELGWHSLEQLLQGLRGEEGVPVGDGPPRASES